MIIINSSSDAQNMGSEPDQEFTFWSVQGKIIPGKLYEFFGGCNIGLYYSNDNESKNEFPAVVEVTENMVSEVNEAYLKKRARDYVFIAADPLKVIPILDSLHRSVRFFGKSNQHLLTELKLNFIRDTKDSAYLFFQNGIVEITADAIQLIPYGEIEGYVWAKNIVAHEFTPVPYTDLAETFDFHHFLQDVTRVDDAEASEQRFNSLFSVLGYLSHRYKDPTITKAIILMDASPDGSGNGRTGKTLFCQSIGKVRTLSEIPGKSFDHSFWFRFSGIRFGTNIILFDDVDKDFDFEKIYPLVTTGLSVQRIGKDTIHFSYEDSPKIVLTTNYTIIGEGSSYRGRTYEFEFSHTFDADFQPIDKYGKRFFDDWDVHEWNQFYNLIAYAIQFYLQKGGLVESAPINMKLSKLIDQTNEDFAEFAKSNIVSGVRYDKGQLFIKFKREYTDYGSLRQRTFTSWLKQWSSYLGVKIEETRSDSIRYIIFIENSGT